MFTCIWYLIHCNTFVEVVLGVSWWCWFICCWFGWWCLDKSQNTQQRLLVHPFAFVNDCSVRCGDCHCHHSNHLSSTSIILAVIIIFHVSLLICVLFSPCTCELRKWNAHKLVSVAKQYITGTSPIYCSCCRMAERHGAARTVTLVDHLSIQLPITIQF